MAEEQDPQLVQVVYVTRHGLRTPLSDSNETICGFPWECLSKEETMKIYEEEIELHRADEGQEHGMSSAQVSRTRLPPGPFEATFSGDKSTALFGKNCAAGQLTLPGHMVRGKTGLISGLISICRFQRCTDLFCHKCLGELANESCGYESRVSL